MDTADWRTQLPSESRRKVVNKIFETLKKHLPFAEPEGINELNRIAARFEEKIFNRAINQTDYLRQISVKMLTFETESQSAVGYSLSVPLSIFDAEVNSLPLGRLIINENSETSVPNREPAVDTGDWRIQHPPDSRQKSVNALMETLKKHVPYSGQEGIEELMRIAASFEELISNTAVNQKDYIGKISLKMKTMEEGD